MPPQEPGAPEPPDTLEPPDAPEGIRGSESSRARPAAAVLALHHAAKSFGAVRAVTDGTIDLYAGEAHALVGENGAGKSTVVKILSGVHQPDAGELLIDGSRPACTARPVPATPGSPSSTRSPLSSPT